jgi:hypothetical protein
MPAFYGKLHTAIVVRIPLFRHGVPQVGRFVNKFPAMRRFMCDAAVTLLTPPLQEPFIEFF